MGKATGFLEYTRTLPSVELPQQRVKHFKEFTQEFSPKLINSQAARCMDCGIPFCHNGCPLGNIIPEFNDAVYKEQWALAVNILTSTNNFPEFTGRICPAPCESACVLGINQPPVSIEFIEKTIIEKAFKMGLIKAQIPAKRTEKKIAIVGSGPSGLAAATQLNKVGHRVTVFERAKEVGGLLRYGIPDFKLDKAIVKRRVSLMNQEGVKFKTNIDIGKDIPINQLEKAFDAIILTIGSTTPRDLPIEGRELDGVHFAMDFLSQQNSRNDQKKENISHKGTIIDPIWATDKHVVVIGGGDTGSDCVGTSNRQKAKSITQIEVLGKPPKQRSEKTPWPFWPHQLRTSSSHEEGVDRKWSVAIQRFLGDGQGKIKGLHLKEMGWVKDKQGNQKWQSLDGTDYEISCDLALLAVGFLHPEKKRLIDKLNLDLDERGNIKSNASYKTSRKHIFAAGDCRRGQSLVVWAISEGRECAYHVDEYLMGHSNLERKNASPLAIIE